MYRIYLVALMAVISMCMVAVFAGGATTTEKAGPAVTAAAKPAKAARQDADDEALLLRRDGSGQFHLKATVNGTEVPFLVDTGADMVALTEEQAADLGLNVNEGDFQPVMQTASGTGYGASVTLDEIEVGGVRLHSVEAVVVKGLTVNLLGQTVLRQLGGIELKGDRMVIHPR